MAGSLDHRELIVAPLLDEIVHDWKPAARSPDAAQRHKRVYARLRRAMALREAVRCRAGAPVCTRRETGVPVLRSSVKLGDASHRRGCIAPGTRATREQDRSSGVGHHCFICGEAPVSRNAIWIGYFHIMTDRPLANFDLEKAIALRWALRDIAAKRLKLTPLNEDDLQTLIELGFVEMRDGTPVVTPSGLAALE
jgi:hypothetical protein